jgi:hypothetical protein
LGEGGKRTVGEPERVLELGADDLGAHDVLVFVVEWECSCEERVQDHTERPHVDLCASAVS